MFRRIVISTLFLVAVCLCGCSIKEGDLPDTVDNRDPLNTYYSSYSLPIGADHISDVIDMDTHICVVGSMDTSSQKEQVYRLIMIDKDKRAVSSSCDVSVNDHSSSFCKTSGNKLVCAKTGGYRIIDPYTGEILTEESIPDMLFDDIPSVATSGDGFVFITSEKFYKVSGEGKIIDSMDIDVEGTLSYRNDFFTENGHEYLVTTEDGSSFVYFYEVDLDSHRVDLVSTDKAFDVDPWSVFEYGKYSYDDLNGVIYELDIARSQKRECAYMKNMLIKPVAGMPERFYILDRDLFVASFLCGSDMQEIVVIKRDDSLNMSDRQTITVAGDYVNDDKSLTMAAYQYNSLQNKYFVKIESWGDDYRWSTSKDAESRNLRLIQRMQNGDVPDILYGYSLDYNSLGKMGIVQDLMPYIKNSNVITKDKLNDHMYDLMTKNGHCYQLFNGYAFNGFCGKVLPGEHEGMDFYSNEANKDNLQYKYNAVDMLNFMLGYPLEQLSSDGVFISEEQVADAISLSVTSGSSHLEQTDAVVVANNGGSIVYATYGTIPGLLKMSDKGSFEYYGFPTYGGSSYCIQPMGLTAISSGSKHPQEAFEFLEYLYTYDAQRMVLSDRYFPVCDDVYDEYKEMMRDPGEIPSDDHLMILLASELLELRGNEAVYRDIPDVFFDDLERSVNSVNKVMYVDFAIYNILTDELNSYYLQGKAPKDIAVSLRSRLMLYIKENGL